MQNDIVAAGACGGWPIAPEAARHAGPRAEQLPALRCARPQTAVRWRRRITPLAVGAGDAIRAIAGANYNRGGQVFTVSGAHFDWSRPARRLRRQMSLFAERKPDRSRSASPAGKPGKDGSRRCSAICEQPADDVRDPGAAARGWTGPAKQPWFIARSTPPASSPCASTRSSATAAGWIAAAPGAPGPARRVARRGSTWPSSPTASKGNLLAAHQEIQKLALLYRPANWLRAGRRRRCSTWPATTFQARRSRAAGRPGRVRCACSKACG